MQEQRKNTQRSFLTTHEIAGLLGVTMQGVIKWIDKGLLKAKMVTPGGHRRIAREDFESFLKDNKMTIPSAAAKERKDIFVIDDEVPILNLISKAFAKYYPDYRLTLFHNGIDALIEAGNVIPSLIIVDIMMPEIDGYELIKRLKQHKKLSSAAILAISGKVDELDSEKMLNETVDMFITKPFDIKDFVKKADGLIKKRNGGSV